MVNSDIAHHLLARLKEFTEWSQCLVLQLLARYQPADEEEIFDILVWCILKEGWMDGQMDGCMNMSGWSFILIDTREINNTKAFESN